MLKFLQKSWYHSDSLRTAGSLVSNRFHYEFRCSKAQCGHFCNFCLIESLAHKVNVQTWGLDFNLSTCWGLLLGQTQLTMPLLHCWELYYLFPAWGGIMVEWDAGIYYYNKTFPCNYPSWMNFKIIFNKGRSKIYVQSWSVIQLGDVSYFGRHCWRLEAMEAEAEVWMVHAALKSARLWVNIICAPPQPARHQIKSNLYYVHRPTSIQISSFDIGGVQRSNFFNSSKELLTFSYRSSRNCFL